MALFNIKHSIIAQNFNVIIRNSIENGAQFEGEKSELELLQNCLDDVGALTWLSPDGTRLEVWH